MITIDGTEYDQRFTMTTQYAGSYSVRLYSRRLREWMRIKSFPSMSRACAFSEAIEALPNGLRLETRNGKLVDARTGVPSIPTDVSASRSTFHVSK